MEHVVHYLQVTVKDPSHWETDWSLLWDIEGYKWNGALPLSQPLVPFFTLFIYLNIIFFLQFLMKNRQEWNTNVISAIHNLILTFWSLAMCVGTGYYAFSRAIDYGSWTQLVCEHSSAPSDGPLYFIGYWYYLSKYYELLDTIILCLRKRPLTVLHVYHHSVVILLTYLWVASDYSLFWWTVWLNTMVHVFMYFYFFMVSLKRRVPNFLKKMLTRGQITQFCVFGIVACLNVYFTVQNFQFNFENVVPANGDEIGTVVNLSYSYVHSCKGSLWILAVSILVNITILSLFLNFFKQNYSKKPQRKVKGPTPKKKRK